MGGASRVNKTTTRARAMTTGNVTGQIRTLEDLNTNIAVTIILEHANT